MFRTVPLCIIRSFSLYTHQWYMSYMFADSCSQLSANWNCPKHVEFHSKNKFEKLVYLVGFIIRNIRNYFYGNINFDYFNIILKYIYFFHSYSFFLDFIQLYSHFHFPCFYCCRLSTVRVCLLASYEHFT